ncbi:MAG: diguanylate cyclase [Firmicutes bacterium]|nr:diguanylate cyclase [Bacillota bacterium]
MTGTELADLANQLAATEDSSRVGDLVVKELVSVSGGGEAKIYLLNRGEGLLISLTDKGEKAKRDTLSLSEATLPALALRQRCPIRAGKDLAVPLFHAGREVGVVVVEGVKDFESLEKTIDQMQGVLSLTLIQLMARQEMLHQWRFLEVITTLNWLITSSLGSREFYDALHQLIKGLIDFDWIKILVNEGNRITALAFFRDGESVAADDAIYPSDLTLQARFSGGQPEMIEDLQTVQELASDEFITAAGLHSVLLVPLVAKSGVIGGLCFYSREKGKYAEKDFPLAQQLAGQLATAIENTLLIREMARKNQEIEDSHRRLATLNSIAETLARSLELEMVLQDVLQKVMEAAQWDAGAIFLEEDNKFTLAVHRGLPGDCAEVEGAESTFYDAQLLLYTEKLATFGAAETPPVFKSLFSSAGFSFGVVVPLKYKKKVRGVLMLFHKTKGDLSLWEQEVLEAVGNQTGVALENARLYRKVKMMAEHDALTGLYNRHKFFALLDLELKRCRRYNTKCGVLLLDIDHFKDYNDTFGHLAGDECLRRAARIFAENVRESDIVARYGGEEFVVLVVETDAQGVISVAERLRKQTEAVGEKEPFPTVSIGMALYPDDAFSTQDLLLIADNALYTAKRLGRNRIVWRDTVQNGVGNV